VTQAQAQAQAQAHAQAQQFLFHCENGYDAGISTSASTRIKIFPFSFLVLMLEFALQQVETKNHSGITQAKGYLPHMDTCMFGH